MQPNYKTIALILAIAIVVSSVTIYFLIPVKTQVSEKAFPQQNQISTLEKLKRVNAREFDTSQVGGSLRNEVAVNIIGTYRLYKDAFATDTTYGLWHHQDKVRDYIADVLPWFTDSVKPVLQGVDLSTYKWKVGFYFTACLVRGKARLSCCLIPTLIDTTGQKPIRVIDFYKYPSVYANVKMPPRIRKKGECDTCYVYDTGELWP